MHNLGDENCMYGKCCERIVCVWEMLGIKIVWVWEMLRKKCMSMGNV